MSAIGSRSLLFSVATTDFTNAATNARITAGDAGADTLTFADAALSGLRLYQLAGTCLQDLAAMSLWRKMWDAPGSTVAFLLKYYGNATASTSQPHVSGNALVSEPDGDFMGGAANVSSTLRYTTDFAWDCTAKPTLVTT